MGSKKKKSPEEMGKLLLTGGSIGTITFVMVIILFFSGFVSVPAGHKGVIMNSPWGPSSEEIDEGWNWKMKYIVSDIDVRRYNMQTTEMVDYDSVTVRSSDNLNVVMDVSLIYEFDSTKVADIFIENQNIYQIINNNLRNTPRNIAANYTGEFIGGEGRATVEAVIENSIRLKLADYDIIVDDFMIRDVDLPQAVDDAIEEKKAAEQQVVTANYTREKLLIEADAQRQVLEIEAEGARNATVIEANGSAEAVRIVVEQLKAADPEMNNTMEAYLTWLYTQALTDQNSNIQYIIVTDGEGTPIMIDVGTNNQSS